MSAADVPPPTPAQARRLNEEYYAARPWTYFQMRMTHLALAHDHERHRGVFAEELRLGPMKIAIGGGEEEKPPSALQRFVAIDTELLLHHAAETLLRIVHAHSEPSDCPWVRMARLTSSRRFKEWVKTAVAKAEPEACEALCHRVFACAPNDAESARTCSRYLQIFSNYFLDAASYNAAKHGMALQGGSQQVSLEIENVLTLQKGGESIEWLTRWPFEDPERPTRWTRARRLLNSEAAVALIYVASQLMEAAWVRGQHEHLDQPWDEFFRPIPPEQLFEACGVSGQVAAEIYEPLPAEGEEQELIVVWPYSALYDAAGNWS